ncbi:hypothetical protein BJ138DRAFT_1265 [Hygrophoropsis aurantiaca]|uniref:Uncharacterized protein n=1 Tax=Hygrophoropsis aurantiaca TaxID=72124 RepID=A0ACB8AT13_9AGAM|nr:hypothetical protein BJ138DRAFT_1265 [Hygrophoropsis aurantiaca]
MVELWDIHSSSFIRALKPKSIDQGFVSSLSVSPDARKLAVLYGEIVHIYHLETGILSTSRVLAEGNDQSQVITWSPNSDRMLTYTTNPEHGRKSTQASVVHGWRITDSAIEPIAEAIKLHRYGPATNIMFPGETIIYINQERDIIIGHLENGHFQTQIQRRQEDCCYPYTLSPDGQMFACATRDRMCVMLRDATSGNVIGGPLQNSSGRAISSLCFTSGGKQLVSLCPYTTIRFWDVEAAIELYRVANSQAEATTSSVLKEVNLSISTPLFNDNAPHQEEGPSTTTPTSLNTPRRRSGSSDSSILNVSLFDRNPNGPLTGYL